MVWTESYLTTTSALRTRHGAFSLTKNTMKEPHNGDKGFSSLSHAYSQPLDLGVRERLLHLESNKEFSQLIKKS